MAEEDTGGVRKRMGNVVPPKPNSGGVVPDSPGLARRTQDLIDDATAGFVGRAYVFDRIESFIA